MTEDELRRLARVRRMAKNGEAKRVRLASNLSLREMSSQLDVDPSTLARWENGESRPRTDAALRWEGSLSQLRDAVAA